MKPAALSKRLDALVIAFYDHMVRVDKLKDRVETAIESCERASLVASYSDEPLNNTLKSADRKMRELSYEIAGLNSVYQEMIWKIEEATSDLSPWAS